MGEFSLGPDNITPDHPLVVNPANPAWTLGSTSTGSAAAVAAGLVPFAIGSDTGGSIRYPAMMARVAGLKPTTGRLPLAGAFPLAPLMDTIGPMARNAKELLRLWNALGLDEADADRGTHKSLRIGFIRHFLVEDIDPSPETLDVFGEVTQRLEEAGHEVEEVRLPSLAEFNRHGWNLLLFEAAAIHRTWLKDCPELYHPQTLSDLRRGQQVTEEDCRLALKQRVDYRRRVDAVFEDFDLLLTAVSGQPGCALDDDEGLQNLDATAMRVPFSFTGHPALALPAPLTQSGFPLGLQLIGRRFGDRALLQAALRLEEDLSDLVWR